MQEGNARAYEEKAKRCGTRIYALLARGEMTPEDALWYQAFSAYRFLCSFSDKDKLMAATIRRYLFQHKLGGWEDQTGQAGEARYCLPDGSVYASLSEKPLLDRMVQIIRQGYQDCHMFQDEGVAERIPKTPSALRAFLMEETSDRNCLLRFLFVLKLNVVEYNRLLNDELFSEQLSVAVPRELIIRYCLENEIYDWEYVNELQRRAERYLQACTMESVMQRRKQGPRFTGDMEEEWEEPLKGMQEARFEETILYPCCDEALLKSPNSTPNGTRLQYSKSRLEKMWEKSILRDAAYWNQNVRADYQGCYTVSTIFRFREALAIPEDYPLISDSVGRDKVMSRENYCRLFTYRIAAQGEGSRHRVYSMKYGQLPVRLKNSILMYSDIEHLPGKDQKIEKTYAHNIKRYMIMLAVFMKLLLEHWQSHGFLAESQEDAGKLWTRYFQQIRNDLSDTGAAAFTRANPLDAMLCLCLQTINPLECYNRIYELDVLQSFARDDAPYSPKSYPPPERIRRVVRGLRESSRRMAEIDPDYPAACDDFCRCVEEKLERMA